MLRALGLLLFTLLLGSSAHAAPTRNRSREASCKAAVQQFYDWYAPLVWQKHRTAPWDRAVKARSSSFDPELRRWLAVDAAARARQPDEIVGLDFDPFLNSQDPARQYRVQRVIRGKSGYRAYVYAVYTGKVNPAPSAIPELALRHGRWVFLNFHFPVDEGATETQDLLTFLKGRDIERRREARPKIK